jgi:tricorn protease-like protein
LTLTHLSIGRVAPPLFVSTQKDRMSDGYYRFPTIWQDTIVFVSEDDLWSVARQGGVARRLTSNLGEVNYPALSPDGQWLAFVGREEGMPEVYLMPAAGGSAQRMTYLNHRCQVLGLDADGQASFLPPTTATSTHRNLRSTQSRPTRPPVR